MNAAEAEVARLRRELMAAHSTLAVENWLQAHHNKDWYIGNATTAEWEATYRMVDESIAALVPKPKEPTSDE